MSLCVRESTGRTVILSLANNPEPETTTEETAETTAGAVRVGADLPCDPDVSGGEEIETLARIIWLSGDVAPPALCSGLGRCGACRVRFLKGTPEPVDADRLVLGDAAVADGWRLSCRHSARSGMDIELPPPPATRTKRLVAVGTSGKNLRLAVDLGTTSVHWQLLGEEGVMLHGQALNPQMGAGSDVISRLASARTGAGRAVLRKLILQFLQRVVEAIQKDEDQARIVELCVAGNTAMTAILLDLDTSGLATAPYRLPHCGGETVSLPGLPPVWIPPLPAPFVGGDISAGMASLLYEQRPVFPFLLADLGTNGEFVLALDAERSLVASVPLGPSLEGIGLTHGGVADTGSVSGFRLGPSGLVPQVIGGGTPQRLCGTGYLSLLDVLLRTGFLEPSGKVASINNAEQPLSPLARKLRQSVQTDAGGAWYLPLPGDLRLTAFDVEEILKVKAAFSLALERLLDAAKLSSRELVQVVLGGALGEHAPMSALESLGFLPSGLGARVRAAGNTSLAGATHVLVHPELRARLIRWSEQCRVLDLTAGADFTGHYMRHMFFG